MQTRIFTLFDIDVGKVALPKLLIALLILTMDAGRIT
jgi:hypothetical protein